MLISLSLPFVWRLQWNSITADDGYLFTAGTDGVLAVFEIKERDGRLAKRCVGALLCSIHPFHYIPHLCHTVTFAFSSFFMGFLALCVSSVICRDVMCRDVTCVM